jgi:uncharacterized cupredoxin-like copper-binding protein
MQSRIAASVFISLIGLAGLSACGGSRTSTTINISMTDFQYSPNTFYVPAGEVITVHASNTGAIEHDFVIMKYGTTVGENYDDADEANIYWRVDLQPGEETETSFMAPEQPGEYQVVCAVKGHYLAGMIARLIVVAE